VSTQVNGTSFPAVPETEVEKGTVLDYMAGELIVQSGIEGVPKNVGQLFDWREPSVGQFQEMLDMDGKARSLEQVLCMPLIKAGWHIEPDTETKDQTTASWVQEMLSRGANDGGMSTPMDTVVAQMTSAFTNRRSYHEKVWKVTPDNEVMYDKIAWRPPDTCTVLRHTVTGDLIGFTQIVFGKETQVAINNPYAHVYVHGQHRNPVKGISDLTVCYRNYRTKEKLKFLWYTFLEVMSLPRTVVLANGDANAKKAAQAIAALKNAGVAGLPADWIKEIHQLNVSGQGASQFHSAIAYLDADSSLSVLAGFTDLPSRATGAATGSATGSYALAQASSDFFLEMLTAYSVELSTCVTNQIVTDLVRYNKGATVRVPQFTINSLQEPDVQQAATLLQSMATASNINVPMDFVYQLMTTIASELNLNMDELQTAIDEQEAKYGQEAPNQQAASGAPLAAATDVGFQVAQHAQAAMGNIPSEVPVNG